VQNTYFTAKPVCLEKETSDESNLIGLYQLQSLSRNVYMMIMAKEEIVACFKVLFLVCCKGLKKNKQNNLSEGTEVSSEHYQLKDQTFFM
jgi:hypothetical protein